MAVDWQKWMDREASGKLTPKEQAMLDRARREGLVPYQAPPPEMAVQAPPPPTTAQPPATYGPYGSAAPEILTESLGGQLKQLGQGVMGALKGPVDPAQERRRGLIAEELGRPQLPMRPEMASPEFEGVPSTPQDPAGRMALTQGINIGLPAAGAAGGAMLPIPGGSLLGEMAGSYAARRANVLMGEEEPGMTGDIASVLFPVAGRAIGAGAKFIGKRLPGVGDELQAMGVEQARQIAPGLRPTPASDLLYRQVSQMNPTVKLPSTLKAAQEILEAQRQLPKELQSAVRATAEGVEALASQPTDFQLLWQAQKEIRSRMRSTGEDQFRFLLGKIDAAIWQDLDDLAESGHPLAGLLRSANKTYRKERAVETLDEILERSIREATQGGEGTPRLNAGAMLTRFNQLLKQDELFAGAFSRSEQQEIAGTLRELSKIPLPGRLKGQMYGAGSGLATFMAGLGVTGDPQTAAMGGMAMWGLSEALTTEPGRKLVRALATSGQLYTPAGAAALRGFIRGSGQGAME